MKQGRALLILSVITRLGVIVLLCFLAFMTEYINFKTAHNNSRLVELSAGKPTRIFYDFADGLFARFGDPLEVSQTNGGMTWSIRILGVPFTDPVAALSVLAKNGSMETGFILGLAAPFMLAFIFGRVFCSYICPASLVFFSVARLRQWLGKWFYFPDFQLNRGFAWGILLGGLTVAVWTGHGIWTLILPYFAVGQNIFHGIAFGTLSVSLASLAFFVVLDLAVGRQFTCRYICPTGRLLGFIGQKSAVSVKRDASACLDACQSCVAVCPMKADPKHDNLLDCSLCGECLVICPTQCLSTGFRGFKPLAFSPGVDESGSRGKKSESIEYPKEKSL